MSAVLRALLPSRLTSQQVDRLDGLRHPGESPLSDMARTVRRLRDNAEPLDKTMRIVLAEEDGEIHGWSTVERWRGPRHEVTLLATFVRPDKRGQGLGRKLATRAWCLHQEVSEDPPDLTGYGEAGDSFYERVLGGRPPRERIQRTMRKNDAIALPEKQRKKRLAVCKEPADDLVEGEVYEIFHEENGRVRLRHRSIPTSPLLTHIRGRLLELHQTPAGNARTTWTSEGPKTAHVVPWRGEVATLPIRPRVLLGTLPDGMAEEDLHARLKKLAEIVPRTTQSD